MFRYQIYVCLLSFFLKIGNENRRLFFINDCFSVAFIYVTTDKRVFDQNATLPPELHFVFISVVYIHILIHVLTFYVT